MRTLQEVIDEHEASPWLTLPAHPKILPPTHLTDRRNFEKVIRDLEIAPSFCSIFQRNLVYLFYGGVYYRRHDGPRPRKEGVYPVAFLFRSEILGTADCYYPFDTGAMHDGLYHDHLLRDWRERWPDWTRVFCVDSRQDCNTPAQLLRYTFGTNRAYRRGEVSILGAALDEPFPELIEFLQLHQTSGVDQRRYRIECHLRASLSLQDLLWVGFPEEDWLIFAQLAEVMHPHAPHEFQYATWESGDPREMAAMLQDRALEFVRHAVDDTI
jgi:hypothetical protein